MKITRTEWAALAAVMLLAAWLRFGYVGVNSFAFDEARLSLIALRMARGGEFASVGMPSSAGVPNMPAAAWLFALPYALTPNPQLATWFVSALSLLSVVGVWWLARGWGVRAGLLAALFLAANPFAVLYGRSVWAQNLLIPLAVGWLLAVTLSRSRRAAVYVALAVFLSGFAVQVHFAGAALAIAGGVAFVRGRWWRYPLAVTAGAGVAIVCALPFMLTPGAVRGVLDAAGGGSQVSVTAWQHVGQLALGAEWGYLLHGEAELPLMRANAAVIMGGMGALLAVLVGMMGVFGAAAVLGVDAANVDTDDGSPPSVATTNTAYPTYPTPPLGMVLALLIAPPLLFTRHSTPVLIHYLLTALPAVALLLAWLAHRTHWLKHAVTVLVMGAALVWVGGLFRAFPYAAAHHTPNGLATPLGTLQHAANQVTPPALYVTHGDNPNTQGEPAIFTVLWWGQDVRIIDGRSVLILPPYPATIMFTERPFQAWEEMRASDLFADLREIPRRDGVEPWQVTPYDGDTFPAGFTLLDEPVTFAHGGVLLGWRTYTIGTRTRVSTLWRADGAIGANVQQFHHLRTSTPQTGAPFAVSDVSVRGHTWQAGDLVIVMGDFIDLAPGDYAVEVGHYTLPDVTRIPHAAGDLVQLGTFTAAP